jgi:hypothetical protein
LDSLETKKGQNGEYLSRSKIASENFGGKFWREIGIATAMKMNDHRLTIELN